MSTTKELLKPKITYADTLRFTAYAYSKLLYFRDRGSTEVAGFCITGTDDPLLVTDFKLIKQQCSSVSFDLDKDDIAQYQESTLEEGLALWQSLRILAHSHPPGCSPSPSEPDEKNFREVFAKPSWAVMLIIANGGKAYCRLKINVGPGVETLLKVEVDFSQSFKASDHESWNAEYAEKVAVQKFRMTGKEGFIPHSNGLLDDDPLWCREYDKWAGSELDDEPDCMWDEDGRVWYYDDDEEKWYIYDPRNQKWYMDNDDNSTITPIKRPKESWTMEVVMWANSHANEEDIIISKS